MKEYVRGISPFQPTHDIIVRGHHRIAAGPESLEDYFQKGSLLGQKAALNLWYITRYIFY